MSLEWFQDGRTGGHEGSDLVLGKTLIPVSSTGQAGRRNSQSQTPG